MDFARMDDVPGAQDEGRLERQRIIAAVKFMGLSKPGTDHDFAETRDAERNRGLSPVLAKLRDLLIRAMGRLRAARP